MDINIKKQEDVVLNGNVNVSTDVNIQNQVPVNLDINNLTNSEINVETGDSNEVNTNIENSNTVDYKIPDKLTSENDYEMLKNLPKINGVELKGNKTTQELGIEISEETDPTVPKHVKEISEEDINKWNNPEIPDTSEFIKNTVDNLVNYYLKSEVYNKEEINELASTLQNVSISIVDNLPNEGKTNVIYFVKKTGKENDIYNEWIYINNTWEHIGNTQVDLTGYATEQWVKNQEYMPIEDFQQYMNYFYYKKEEVYNKDEIDTKLNELPSGGTELIGGDNIVIEDSNINAYTNTGYKVSDKDVQLQSIVDSGTTGTNKIVYIDGKEILIIYDGTNKIRHSENGIDFKIITLPCNCKHMVYNSDYKILFGTDNSKYFIYSYDYGLTWNTISQTRASSVTMMGIGFGSGFRSYHKSTKEIISWSFNSTNNTLSMNTRITSTIIPEFSAMINNTQFVWCNNTGTFKYGAGSQEGNFASITGIVVNLLKRVNNITILGLKNSNKIYLLEPASMVTQYKWIEHSLPDVCTANDIIYNPYDETYYLFADINTYYKTKDFVEFEPFNKNNLKGIQGYFTLMGIQMTTANHNELFLAPTRTKLENKLQEHDRDLNKSLWVGKGLGLTEEGKVDVKTNSEALGVTDYGIYLKQISDYNLPEDMIEGIYVAKAKEKDLFDPYEVENWFYSEESYVENASYNAVKFLFNQAGSFYDQVTWETEYFVEQYEYGYLFYDTSYTIFKYVKLGNKSWMFE